MDAYNLYLRALNAAERAEILQRSEERLLAVQMLEQAVEMDPQFALAWAALSQEHALLFFNGEDRTEERLEKALAAVERALEIDPDLPQARVALGSYFYWGPRDYDQALEQFMIAEKSLPNDSDLMASIGLYHPSPGSLRGGAGAPGKSFRAQSEVGTAEPCLGHHPDAARPARRS